MSKRKRELEVEGFEFKEVHATNIVPLRIFANAMERVAGHLIKPLIMASDDEHITTPMKIKYRVGNRISHAVSQYTTYYEMKEMGN